MGLRSVIKYNVSSPTYLLGVEPSVKLYLTTTLYKDFSPEVFSSFFSPFLPAFYTCLQIILSFQIKK